MKDTKKTAKKPDFVEEKIAYIHEQNITETLEKNYMPYAMSVIVSRAIPEIDGFKPSHRKILYTMYKKGLLTGPRTKSANVVGETMKLNPHGDQAIYATMVRLSRGHAALIHPYVDSKGNFGKAYSRDMQFAAPRYTEVKLAKICEELVKDLDKNAVDFVDNYDGTMKEPVLFPVTFPTILINENQGVAVGMATNICSFNLSEVCKATTAYIDDQSINVIDYIKAPDFSTGATAIYKQKDMQNIIDTGRGSIKLRAKYRFDKKVNCLEIYEIPYSTTVEAIIDVIADLVKKGRIKEIVDIRDETDLEGLCITIDIRKGVDPDLLMTKLYTLTPLECSFSCNFNILIKGKPMVLGVKDIIKEWLIFRTGCIKRQLAYEIKNKQDRLHLLKGLEKLLLDIDKAIKIIRETEKDDLVVPNLMWGFSIDELQANFIAEIKLRNLNKEYILNKVSEISKLQSEIKNLQEILGSEILIKKMIKEQLTEVEKKYGQPRLTDIIHEDDVISITHEEMIEDYNLKILLTRESYFKKIPLTALRTSPEQKIKDDDFVMQEADWHNKSEILFISNKAVVYKMKIHELPEGKAAALGEYLPNLLGMDSDERIVRFIVTDNYCGSIIFAFVNGKASRIPLSLYETKTNRKKLINAYSDKSPVIGVVYFQDEIDVGLVSSNDKILVVNSTQIPEKTTKTTQGIQVMKLKKGQSLKLLQKVSDMNITNTKAYRTKNLPAAGSNMKDEAKPIEQLTLL